MTPIKKDLIELVMTNPHLLDIKDLIDHLSEEWTENSIHRAVIELCVDDNIFGVDLNWRFFVYDSTPPYVGEG